MEVSIYTEEFFRFALHGYVKIGYACKSGVLDIYVGIQGTCL